MENPWLLGEQWRHVAPVKIGERGCEDARVSEKTIRLRNTIVGALRRC